MHVLITFTSIILIYQRSIDLHPLFRRHMLTPTVIHGSLTSPISVHIPHCPHLPDFSTDSTTDYSHTNPTTIRHILNNLSTHLQATYHLTYPVEITHSIPDHCPTNYPKTIPKSDYIPDQSSNQLADSPTDIMHAESTAN